MKLIPRKINYFKKLLLSKRRDDLQIAIDLIKSGNISLSDLELALSLIYKDLNSDKLQEFNRCFSNASFTRKHLFDILVFLDCITYYESDYEIHAEILNIQNE